MSNRKPLIIPKSCLVLAVLALSACSSNPVREDDSAIGAVSDTLSRAGAKTRDLSVSAWDKTLYLLGFSDINPETRTPTNNGRNDQLLDEVDLALLEEDAILPADFNSPAGEVLITALDAPPTPIVIPSPSQTPKEQSGEFNALMTDNQSQSDSYTPDDIFATSIEDATSVFPEAEEIGTSVLADAPEPYFHEVSDTQTLWEIAKSTTGDANNWHTIADVNDLIQSTSVYPGQQLLIPAELLKPELAQATIIETPTVAAAQETPIATDQPVQLDLAAAVDETTTIMGVSNGSQAALAKDRLKIPDGQAAVAQAETQESSGPDSVEFELSDGESLWEFARRTTGDATNWQEIATLNGFDESAARLVFPGQVIAVPSELVRSADSSSSAAETALSETPQLASAESSETTNGTAEESIQIVQANFQTEPVAFPEIDPGQPIARIDESETTFTGPGEIVVSGTHYPKAVFHDKNFSSSPLTRVLPGTRLTVSKVYGQWIEVMTDQGVGYLHERDVR